MSMSKRLLPYVIVGLLIVALPGCTESVLGVRSNPALATVAGEWLAAPDDIGAVGWYQKTLALSPNGRFASTSASYGLYEGQSRNDPSAWTRIEGRFRIEGNRLHFQPETITWWDQFESATYPAPRHMAYPWA